MATSSKSTTNLDAFEDFLASLPQFDSSDENQEDGANLPEIGFDGMPSDLLSALREQVSRAREHQSAQQPEQEEAPAVISDATTIGEGYQPAVAEPKLSCPGARSASCSARREPPRRRRKRLPPVRKKKSPSLLTPRTSRKPWTTGIPPIPARSKTLRITYRTEETGTAVPSVFQASGPPLTTLPPNKSTNVRSVLEYVPYFRDKIFAVHVERPLVDSEELVDALLDLDALQEIGVRPVLIVEGTDASALYEHTRVCEMRSALVEVPLKGGQLVRERVREILGRHHTLWRPPAGSRLL